MFINIIGNKEKTIGNRKNIVDLIGKIWYYKNVIKNVIDYITKLRGN